MWSFVSSHILSFNPFSQLTVLYSDGCACGCLCCFSVLSACFFFSIQEKYKRDQEKLQEEWVNAQKDISKSPNQQEVTTRDANYPSIH